MRKLSIRMRLTLFVALLLSVLCLMFTLLVQQQMRTSLIEPMHAVIPLTVIEPEADEMAAALSEPAQPLLPAMQSALDQGERLFTTRLWLIMGGVVLLGSLLTYAVSAVALRPIRSLAQTVDALDEHTLTCRLDHFQAGDEVAHLAASFDALLSRLRSAFDRERRFNAYAAHELKTPLAVVKTALDVMDEEDYADPAVCRETMQTIAKQNERMISLSAQLLTLSRLQSGFKAQRVRADALAEEIATELQPLAEEHGVTLTLHLCALDVWADPLMLKQALSNMVENAIRYNHPQGSVDVEIRGRALVVSDTGVGVPVGDVEHVFEPFYRVDKSRSRSAGGTGLGLAITREILSGCGATVRVEANHPAGSRFIVDFPQTSHNEKEHAAR